MKKRKICVVTGTRAEYGLFYWLLKEIDADPALDLQLIVTGTHLSPEFGLTYKDIEKDGFNINEKVEMLMSSDTPIGITKSIGLAVIGFAETFQRMKPDIVVLLGDRYEILAAAQAALVAKIPIAHIHGGETTEGAIDEAIRHSITKMAQIHFVAAEPYRKRVIQLGENPDRVMNFGALGIDNIKKMTLLPRDEFEKAIDFNLGEINFLVTYHPETLSNLPPEQPIKELMEAIEQFPEANVIFTKSNSDTHGRVINKYIDEYVSCHSQKATSFISLGQLRYLSAIKHVDVVIGNSSSGIIEVPSFKKPTVNIGDRQKGRLRTESIIDCSIQKEDIVKAIHKALHPNFKSSLDKFRSPYGEGYASIQMKNYLKEVDLDGILMKSFYNLTIDSVV